MGGGGGYDEDGLLKRGKISIVCCCIHSCLSMSYIIFSSSFLSYLLFLRIYLI